ncbi:MAG: ATPase, partial [Flavobacteriales bacterium]|nr:ATPase [Flavobacteriales bacterium]
MNLHYYPEPTTHMILIADSGSTKCDWALLDESGNKRAEFETMGLNPYFHSEEQIENSLRVHPALMECASSVTHVFFYGAGSSTEQMCNIMRHGLSKVFTHAEIAVEHDLLGSAMATYDGEPCISCILGTGSNSCYFDGREVFEEVPSLAYILGDEASGSYFGKKLLQAYFYKQLPDDLRNDFEKAYAPTKEDIIYRIYRQPNANTYLASFMKFIGEHRDHPLIVQWITDGMRHFIGIHVKCFANWREVPVHFVGSIGHYFEHCLRKAAEAEGIRLGRIVQKPIDGLVEYHVRYKIPQLAN